jgi:general secretion pathway protein D
MSRTTRFRIALILLCLLPALPIAAQEPPGVVRSPAGIEFDFQEADFRVVASALAEAAGLSVIFGNIPARRVTLRTARPITVSEVRGYLESLVRTNGFAMIEEGGLIRIVPDAAALGAPTRARPALSPDALRLFTYPLRHAEADQLARTLAALFGIDDPGSGYDAPRSLTEQLREQRMPPLPGERVRPEPATPIGAPAQRPGLAVGLQAPVHIVPDPRTNTLLIRATEDDFETIRAAIEQLDARPLQVLIEVLVAEVRRDRQLGLGIDVVVPEQTVDGTTISGTLIGRGAGDVRISLTGVGGINADVLLQALATSADINILARPVLLTENNQEARILVGTQRPFIQLFRSLPTDAAIRDQIVQYRDVGTQLTFRPTINPDGYVSLVVLQEVSNATAETQFGAPVISTREVGTRLLVRDGQTAVIGGLVDQQREVTTSGIPFLKDIPLLGWLFGSTQTRRGTTELFLFITPHVVVDDWDLDNATRQVEKRPRMREPIGELPPVLVPDTLRRQPNAPPPPR